MDDVIENVEKVERHEVTPYGFELILDLHGCNAASFTRNHLDLYFTRLCDLIDMEKCEVHFWDDVGVPIEERQTSLRCPGWQHSSCAR